MKNYLKSGEIVTVTTPAGGVSSGELLIVGALAGVAITSAVEGESVEIMTKGVFTLPKASSATFTSGAVVSYDVSLAACVAPASGKYPIGVATAAAGAGVLTMPVKLDGIATAAA